MCTALTFKTKDNYFGRTLDLDSSYGEEICIVPRGASLEFRCTGAIDRHYAIIGMATIIDGSPLFYDGANEYGLCMAGLNFPGNAFYMPMREGCDNITPFEFIPWILGGCKSVFEARKLISRINLVDVPFSEELPLSPLHWMISDSEESVVVEQMQDGLHVYENPVGVMTNNPPFEYQLFNLNNYRNLRTDNGENSFDQNAPISAYCQGLGALGLPGDVSSMSRFVRAAFARAHSTCKSDENSSVSQFFHILGSAEMTRGVCKTETGALDITVYTSCINADKGLYYYTTYDNHEINCVDMHRIDLDGLSVSRYPLMTEMKINMQN